MHVERSVVANWGAAAAAALMLVGGTAAATPAQAAGTRTPADAPPTLTIASSLAGKALPVTLGDTGGWQRDGGTWTARIRSASPAGGETRIRSTWTSPTFHVRPRQTYFAFDVEVTHQGAPTRVNAFVQQVRLCAVGGRCARWVGIGADDLPDEFTAAAPFQVSAGAGLSIGSYDENSRGYVQFRFRQVQRDLDEQDMTMRVAAGPAATRLADHPPA